MITVSGYLYHPAITSILCSDNYNSSNNAMYLGSDTHRRLYCFDSIMYTPRKNGILKRNEIVFTSPTGEQITSKSKLENYLRSHPGGPRPSEFDWGIGDTPRRSSRVSIKTRTADIPKDEKSKKKQRKSISKKGLHEKNKDTESDAPEEAKDAAATKESVELEMTDAEDHAKEENAAATVEQGLTEKKEGPEEAACLPDGEMNAKEVEGKEDSNDLHPVSEETGKQNALKTTEDKFSEDSVNKEEAVAEKDVKEEKVAAPVTIEQVATNKKLEDAAMDGIIAKTEGPNKEGTEEVGKADSYADASHTGSEAKEAEVKEDPIDLPPVSEGHKETATTVKDGVSMPSKSKTLLQGSAVY